MGNRTVLIIDDEMDVRTMLDKSLTAKGYSVITAYNGNQGLVLAKSQQPDLIILDRVLGDMLGEEVAANLRKDPRTTDIPILYISALFSKTDEIEKKRLFGGYPMLAKPYDIDELADMIEKAIGKPNLSGICGL